MRHIGARSLILSLGLSVIGCGGSSEGSSGEAVPTRHAWCALYNSSLPALDVSRGRELRTGLQAYVERFRVLTDSPAVDALTRAAGEVLWRTYSELLSAVGSDSGWTLADAEPELMGRLYGAAEEFDGNASRERA